MKTLPRGLRRVRIALAGATAVALTAPAAASAINVYAAASLTDAFPRIDSQTYNFAGSNQLQLQIERGAPADVFASASPAEAQALFKEGRCTRPVTFATNKLVLMVPEGNPAQIRSVYTLRSGGKRLAIGTPGVPIGRYTRQLLRRLGLSKILTNNTVSSEPNVSSVVAKVALRSADAGFGYVTDARTASARIDSIRLPRFAQPPVRYQICQVIRNGVNAAGARAFIDKVRSSNGRRVLRRVGFGLPPR